MRPHDGVASPTSSSDTETVSTPAKPAPSQRKLAANRANAARSTGPSTAEGKAKSSMNAVTHGLSPRTSLLLPGESPQELAAFYDDAMADLRPAGVIERALAERVVAVMWRLRRVVGAEQALEYATDRNRYHAYFATMEHRRVWGGAGLDPEKPKPWTGAGFVAEQLLQQGAGGKATSPLERLGGYEQRLDRSLQNALRQLHQLRKARAELRQLEGESADQTTSAGTDQTASAGADQTTSTGAEQTASASVLTAVDRLPVATQSPACPAASDQAPQPDPHPQVVLAPPQGAVQEVERVEDAPAGVSTREAGRGAPILENEPTESPDGDLRHASTAAASGEQSQIAENEPTADLQCHLLE